MLTIVPRSGFWKRFFAVFVLAALVGGCEAAVDTGTDAGMDASPPAYIAGLEELPLMDPLRENLKERVVFDTPAGRIVETYASGPVTVPRVTAFYRKTLPQLGWRRSAASTDTKMSYEREGERLTIDFPEGRPKNGNEATLKVRFTVRPLGASGGSPKTTP